MGLLRLLVLALLLVPTVAPADPVFPNTTTLAAVTGFPIFYHLRTVVVAGRLQDDGRTARLVPAGGDGRGVDVLWRAPHQADSGVVEARGEFLDVGRLASDDPLTSTPGLRELVTLRVGDRWPAHGELLALVLTSTVPLAPPSQAPSLRAITLDPARYAGQRVVVMGQFGGRNLFADLPRSPGVSRDEFVLRSAGAAIWVTGKPPGGKKWELDPDTKRDTVYWLKVTGTLREGGGLVWLEAASIEPTTPEAQNSSVEPVAAAPPAPAPKVFFSLPAAEETDVSSTVKVRFQVTRDLDPATLPRHVAVSYVGQAADAAVPAFVASFDRKDRVLEIVFAQPLDRFRTVRIELSDGIKGTDGQALMPYTLTFTTGG